MDGNGIKLHLGCGTKHLDGYINIDIQLADGVDVAMDATEVHSIFGSNNVSLIYTCHMLEHIDKNNTVSVLRNWYSTLKPGGKIYIAVPDFDQIVYEYLSKRDIEKLVGLTVGGNKNPYDNHRNLFNYEKLENQLKTVGFTDVKRYEWRDFLPKDYDDYSRAVLPHMDFESGRRMSLNVMATKPGGVV